MSTTSQCLKNKLEQISSSKGKKKKRKKETALFRLPSVGRQTMSSDTCPLPASWLHLLFSKYLST